MRMDRAACLPKASSPAGAKANECSVWQQRSKPCPHQETPRSSENPKSLWVDDADDVGDMIAVVSPISRRSLAREHRNPCALARTLDPARRRLDDPGDQLGLLLLGQATGAALATKTRQALDAALLAEAMPGTNRVAVHEQRLGGRFAAHAAVQQAGANHRPDQGLLAAPRQRGVQVFRISGHKRNDAVFSAAGNAAARITP